MLPQYSYLFDSRTPSGQGIQGAAADHPQSFSAFVPQRKFIDAAAFQASAAAANAAGAGDGDVKQGEAEGKGSGFNMKAAMKGAALTPEVSIRGEETHPAHTGTLRRNIISST